MRFIPISHNIKTTNSWQLIQSLCSVQLALCKCYLTHTIHPVFFQTKLTPTWKHNKVVTPQIVPSLSGRFITWGPPHINTIKLNCASTFFELRDKAGTVQMDFTASWTIFLVTPSKVPWVSCRFIRWGPLQIHVLPPPNSGKCHGDQAVSRTSFTRQLNLCQNSY